MTRDPWTDNHPDPPSNQAPAADGHDADSPRPHFWRRSARRAAEPPPPIWELPEIPTFWTRLKRQATQRAGRWLGERVDGREQDAQQDDTAQLAVLDQSAPPPRPWRPWRREDTARVRPPAAGPDDDPIEEVVISSEVLESTYEAVRQGRISDPGTIRELAARFARLTDDEDLTFDPREAVRALRQRAAKIAQERGFTEDEENPSPSRSREPGAPRRAAPQVERDENITRGG